MTTDKQVDGKHADGKHRQRGKAGKKTIEQKKKKAKEGKKEREQGSKEGRHISQGLPVCKSCSKLQVTPTLQMSRVNI